MIDALGRHFRLWLRSAMPACSYARAFATGRGPMTVESYLTPPTPERLDRVLEFRGETQQVSVTVLPYIRTEEELVRTLRRLADSPRWKLRHAGMSPSGAVLVGLDWTTANGDVSDAMGFAPLISMPVPRRAPYAAIAVWPGGRANAFRGEPPTPRARPGQVSLLDAAHGLSRDQYVRAWASTEDEVATLMKLPPDDARLYRRVAFALAPASAERLFDGAGSSG